MLGIILVVSDGVGCEGEVVGEEVVGAVSSP